MNAVMDALLDQVRKDPTPQGHTSSYWQDYANRIQVVRISKVIAFLPVGVRPSSDDASEPTRGLFQRLDIGETVLAVEQAVLDVLPVDEHCNIAGRTRRSITQKDPPKKFGRLEANNTAIQLRDCKPLGAKK